MSEQAESPDRRHRRRLGGRASRDGGRRRSSGSFPQSLAIRITWHPLLRLRL